MSTTEKRPKAKRIYLINRDFQLRYVKAAVFVGLASTALTMFIILYPLTQMNVIRFPDFLPPPLLWAMGGAAVMNFVIIACLGILVTHRIAGPVYSLVRHIRVLQEGKAFIPLKVRDTDELKYLVRNLNEFIEYLRSVALSDSAKLDAIIGQLHAQGGASEAARLAEDLKADLARRVGGGAPQ